MRWDDVIDGKWLRLRNPKGGKDKVIPLNKTAREIIENQKGKSDIYIFPGDKGPIKNIRKGWEKIKEAAGLPPDFRFHDLRHTFATLLASSGKVDLYVLQNLLTHSTPIMTQRYAHLIEERQQQAVSVLDELLIDEHP